MTHRANDSKWILVTGGTGFVGSSLVSRLLVEGSHVVCLSRSDMSGERTRKAVEDAAEGFGLVLSDSDRSRLKVVELSLDHINQSPNALDGLQISHVWHVAAEMAYSAYKMKESFKSNVTNTCNFYKYMATAHPECQRFYYCSTAYTQGVNGFDSRGAATHLSSEVVNPYQASKWVAELNLELLANQHALPLTVFRPSIIVGHDSTGWSGHTVFGPYGVAKTMSHLSKMGFKHFHVDLEPSARPNFVSINRVVDAMYGLTQRSDILKKIEFYCCAAEASPTTGECFEEIKRQLGVSVAFGKPMTLGDQLLEKVIGLNRAFNNKTWMFDTETLAKEIPQYFQQYSYTVAQVDLIMNVYLNKLLTRTSNGSRTKKKQEFRTVLRTFGIDYRVSFVPVKVSDVKTLVKEAVSSRLQLLHKLIS